MTAIPFASSIWIFLLLIVGRYVFSTIPALGITLAAHVSRIFSLSVVTVGLVSVITCFSTGNLLCNVSDFEINALSSLDVVFIVLFSGVTVLICFTSYLNFDTDHIAFTTTLFIFTVAIVTTTWATRLWIFVGTWEVVGMVSFRLIGHWIFRSNAKLGSYIAIGWNRIGDVCLVLFIASGYFSLANTEKILSNIHILFFIALLTKSCFSAQSGWLPEAMEGPTPVSSTLHSCTLVMAGLIAASRSAIAVSFFSVTLCALSFFIVVVASKLERDVKKIIAWSTVLMVNSMWMIVISGVENTFWAVVSIHAAYKSTVFVVAGKLIANSLRADENSCVESGRLGILLSIVCIAAAFRGSVYFAVKHGLNSTEHFILSTETYAWAFVVAISFWALGIRTFQSHFYQQHHRSFDDGIIIFSFIGVILLLFNMPLSSGSSDISVTIGIITLLAVYRFLQSIRNISLGLSTVSFSALSQSNLEFPFLRNGLLSVLNNAPTITATTTGLFIVSIVVIGIT